MTLLNNPCNLQLHLAAACNNVLMHQSSASYSQSSCHVRQHLRPSSGLFTLCPMHDGAGNLSACLYCADVRPCQCMMGVVLTAALRPCQCTNGTHPDSCNGPLGCCSCWNNQPCMLVITACPLLSIMCPDMVSRSHHRSIPQTAAACGICSTLHHVTRISAHARSLPP